MKKTIGLVILSLVLSAGTASASSVSITNYLTIDHCGGGCGPMPAVSVNVSDFGIGDVLVTVTPLNNNQFVSTGVGGTFLWNLVGDPNITVNLVSLGYSLSGTNAGSIHFDGFGSFEYALSWGQSGGGSGTPNPLVFHVLGNLSAVSFLELSTGNGATPVLFAADIFSPLTRNTGPTGGGSCTSLEECPSTNVVTPEPVSAVLTGSVLLGLAAFGRRRIAASKAKLREFEIA
jgi:hypothetical protein